VELKILKARGYTWTSRCRDNHL